MTALDDLRTALATVERWRDDSRTWNWRRPLGGEDSEVIADFDDEDHGPGTGPVAWGSRDENADLIVAAVSILLDDVEGVVAILRDAIRSAPSAFEAMSGAGEDWGDVHGEAIRLARLVNRIEATR